MECAKSLILCHSAFSVVFIKHCIAGHIVCGRNVYTFSVEVGGAVYVGLLGGIIF
jgi:hypothetical protein